MNITKAYQFGSGKIPEWVQEVIDSGFFGRRGDTLFVQEGLERMIIEDGYWILVIDGDIKVADNEVFVSQSRSSPNEAAQGLLSATQARISLVLPYSTGSISSLM